MEEVCGGRGHRRKRVALCQPGCQQCDPKDLCKSIHVPAKLGKTLDGESQHELKRVIVKNISDSRGRNRQLVEPEDEGERGSHEETSCEKCRRDDDDARMLLCDKCDRGFHMYCLNPVILSVPQGDWFCPLCIRAGSILEVPKVQTKIADFFRIQKLHLSPCSEVKKRRRSSGSFTTMKRSRKLMAHIPSRDSERRLEQMGSLATALASSGITFSDELTYFAHHAPRSSNSPSLEKGGMQVMGKDDRATFDLCKEMWRRGHCAPLMVRYDVQEGFVVEADSPIKDMTIIAEYTGDVDFMCNRVHDEGNSIMGLLFTDDPAKDLVICPDKRGNLARFVSGINNHTPDGRKKLNVRCVRFDVEGQARALLVAVRDISKGERLYYDYNGYHHDYPTQHFV